MATKNKAPDAPLATPENTPIPGGGSWRWDDTLPGWVENVIADGLLAKPQVQGSEPNNPTTPETPQE